MKKIINISVDLGGRVRGKQWAKIVKSIDKTKTNGYCFEGDFVLINRAIEIELPCFVLLYTDEGSTKYHTAHVGFGEYDEQGEYHELLSESGYDYALKMRDKVAEIIEQKTSQKKVCDVCKYEFVSEEKLDKEIAYLAKELRKRVLHKLQHTDDGQKVLEYVNAQIRSADE